jgi:hypothetical protein
MTFKDSDQRDSLVTVIGNSNSVIHTELISNAEGSCVYN